MVFSPYRLFCFLLLKRAGIPTLQVSFTCNQMAWHKKYSIYDSHRHKHTVSLPDLWCKVRRVFIRASLSEKLLHPTQNKAVQFPPIPLDVYFLPTQTTRLPHGVFSTRICALNCFASVDWFPSCNSIRKAATSTKSKAVQFSPIPLDVYLFPTQTARLPHGVFSTRIYALNYFASVDWFPSCNHPTQNKSDRDSPEFVHRIAPPVQTILTLQTHPETVPLLFCVRCSSFPDGFARLELSALAK